MVGHTSKTQKILESKVKPRPDGPVNAGLLVFRYHFSFATVLAANFGGNQFKTMAEMGSKLLLTI